MASLYLVRHGQASFGSENYDRLSGLGVLQAQRAGRYLQVAAENDCRIVSGSLTRHRDTAAEIARCISPSPRRSLQMEVDERLNEFDTFNLIEQVVPMLHDPDGTLASLRRSAKSSTRSYQAVLKRVFLHWQTRVEPLPAMETWVAFATRVRSVLRDLKEAGTPGASTIVVSSGGVIATCVQQVLGLPQESTYSLFEVMRNCSITSLLHDRQRISLASFNECSYLLNDEHGAASPQMLSYR
jgi:broad specificity phosphatase PhoE